MKTFTLKNELTIPALGLGTWQLKGDDCKRAVEAALRIGYRYIDTAEAYDNQDIIGDVLNKSEIKREELFITSKVFHSHLRKNDVLAACENTLLDLDMDYLDMYLIHWPNKGIPISETIEALLQLRKEGKIKMFGVSNFTVHHLKDALTITNEIVNNQVEFHPSLNQTELKEYCDDQEILITAYSPIAQGKDLHLPVIKELAKKYEKPAAQVVLNWLIGKGMNVIPRSTKQENLEVNFKSLNWELDPKDIEKIDTIGGDYRIVKPGFHEFEY